MSAERITRREMLKRLILIPAGTALLLRQSGRAEGGEYYQPRFATVLWQGRTRCDTLWREIRQPGAHLMPTVSGAVHYDRLWWTGYVPANAPIRLSVRFMARIVDSTGNPVGIDWRQVGQYTFTASPSRWFQVEVPEAHWDEYRIEVSTSRPCMLYSRVVGSQGYWRSKLGSEPIFGQASTLIPAKVLLSTMASVSADTARDLLGFAAAEQPTLVDTGHYRGLVVFMYHTTADTYFYTVLARATDINGEPLGRGWMMIKQGTFDSVPATSFSRIDIGFQNSNEAYYDQYRIVVARAGTGTADIYAKVVGVK